jgi:hypothetical protein
MAYDPYSRGDNPWRADLDMLDMPRARPKAKPGAGRADSYEKLMAGRPREFTKLFGEPPPPPPRPPGLGAAPLPPPRPKMTASPVPWQGPPMPTAADELKADRDFGSTPGPTAGLLAGPSLPPPQPSTAAAPQQTAGLEQLLRSLFGGQGVG